MRSISIISLAAVATAIVLPDVQVFEQLSIGGDRPPKGEPPLVASEINYGEADFAEAVGLPNEGHHGDHDFHDLTIYELISLSKHTQKFAKLVKEHDDIVDLLNSTKANYTLFVPTDKAFEHIHHGDKKPSKELIAKVLSYHIVEGHYSNHDLFRARTLPTTQNEPWLGDNPQRLRTRPSLFGARVNFASRVVAGDFNAANGVVHAIDRIVRPPAMVGVELNLLPARFSTLLLAYDRTDFVKFVHSLHFRGSTVFAPDNTAWRRLGRRANVFLFNTEQGKKYLRALLKYQIVANATLYSDAFYREEGDAAPETEPETETLSLGLPGHRHHVDLPTLLGDKPVSVDIVRFAGFARIRVNGNVPVAVQDVISKNGVIQVVGRVPIPPHKHHRAGSAWEQENGPIEVEDLKERLEPYLEEEQTEEGSQDWWGEDL